jgi:polyribonucleotide nucleotidyltransferase
MDAGVPILQPVAGISIGLVDEGSRYTLLTDIMGDEDHFGDMDFKVAGTGRGVTGIQLDLKIAGISEEIIRATLDQALRARKELLRQMLTTKRPSTRKRSACSLDQVAKQSVPSRRNPVRRLTSLKTVA